MCHSEAVMHLFCLIPDTACSRGFARVKGVTCEGKVFVSFHSFFSQKTNERVSCNHTDFRAAIN